jgi:hypothetical protein
MCQFITKIARISKKNCISYTALDGPDNLKERKLKVLCIRKALRTLTSRGQGIRKRLSPA